MELDINELRELYKKLYNIECTDLFELVLAVYASHLIGKEDPVWLFIVGKSSAGKTMNTDALKYLPQIYPLSKVTPQTFVNGSPGVINSIEYMNNRVVLISDFGQFLSLRSEDKQALWAQLREIYDGSLVQEYGTGKKVNIQDLHISIITNATPSIDNQITLFQNLGTREIIYRVRETEIPPLEIAISADVAIIKEQIRTAVTTFFEQKRFTNTKPLKIDKTTEKRIIELAKFVALFRAAAPIDSYSGELRGEVSPEHPLRVAKTLIKLYQALFFIDPNRNPEHTLEIIKRVAHSSVDKNRLRVFKALKNLNPTDNDSCSLSEISKICHLGKKPCLSEISILAALGLAEYNEEINDYGKVLFISSKLTEKGLKWLDWL